jgi:hypothetical protein
LVPLVDGKGDRAIPEDVQIDGVQPCWRIKAARPAAGKRVIPGGLGVSDDGGSK